MTKHSVVAYIPALHRGYIEFLKKYPGPLYVLGSDLVREVPRLERDIRALEPMEVKAAIEGLGVTESVTILTKENIPALLLETPSIVMPDEDVSRQFAGTYLDGKEVSFIPVFLRWDRQISTAESEVPPDRTISRETFDQEVMTQAFMEARKSPDWWRQIGAVLIRDRKPILVAHNAPLPSEHIVATFGDPRSNFDAEEKRYKDLSKFIHAEANVIALAAKQGIPTDGASLYITTFPCPACARSLAVAGIRTVFYSKGYSILDAEEILRVFGVEIVLVEGA
jgi:dCMP deaminase